MSRTRVIKFLIYFVLVGAAGTSIFHAITATETLAVIADTGFAIISAIALVLYKSERDKQ
jgi:hypothetical protein